MGKVINESIAACQKVSDYIQSELSARAEHEEYISLETFKLIQFQFQVKVMLKAYILVGKIGDKFELAVDVMKKIDDKFRPIQEALNKMGKQIRMSVTGQDKAESSRKEGIDSAEKVMDKDKKKQFTKNSKNNNSEKTKPIDSSREEIKPIRRTMNKARDVIEQSSENFRENINEMAKPIIQELKRIGEQARDLLEGKDNSRDRPKGEMAKIEKDVNQVIDSLAKFLTNIVDSITKIMKNKEISKDLNPENKDQQQKNWVPIQVEDHDTSSLKSPDNTSKPNKQDKKDHGVVGS